jgi:hypothetical protein
MMRVLYQLVFRGLGRWAPVIRLRVKVLVEFLLRFPVAEERVIV